ncbi:MAG: ArnT family glycosyltransferase, partial [Bryobacteraceae bacterium]
PPVAHALLRAGAPWAVSRLVSTLGSASVIAYLFLALATTAYLFLFLRILTTDIDQGTYLYGAQMVAQGAVPFRDFPEVSTGAELYWVALFFKLFGASFLAARIALGITGVATVLVAFHLARRIGGTGIFAALFVAVTSIPLMIMNSPHYESNLFALVALAVFLRAESGGGRWTLFLAGVIAGVASCFLQQKGFYVTASFVLSILILHRTERLKRIGIVVGGYLTVAALGAAFYGAEGVLPHFIRFNLRLAKEYHNLNAAPYGWELWAQWIPAWFEIARKLMPAPAALATSLALNLPYLLIMALPFLIGALLWLWKKELWRREIVPYWAAGYGIWLAEMHRHDITHLRNGSILLAILFLTICEKHKSAWPRACVLMLGGCLVLNGTIAAGLALQYKTPIHSRHGTLLARHPDGALQFLLAHTKPGDYIFVYPYRPVYYFLADARNPIPFPALIYHANNAAEFHECVRDLQTKKVKYVLWDAVFSGNGMRSVFPAYRQPPPNRLIMEPYLESHYRQVAYANGFRILERK